MITPFVWESGFRLYFQSEKRTLVYWMRRGILFNTIYWKYKKGSSFSSFGVLRVLGVFSRHPNKDTAINVPHYLNSRHNNIQFTVEFENNYEIPFLDVSVMRTSPSQQPFTARKLSLVFTLNGTHSHLESTRLIPSEHSLIAVSASIPRPLCCNLPLRRCLH